jgi:hypothetical protein
VIKLKTENEIKLCKKITVRLGDFAVPSVLLGLITSENFEFLEFRTANKSYRFAQSCVLAIEDTTVPFIENNNGGLP